MEPGDRRAQVLTAAGALVAAWLVARHLPPPLIDPQAPVVALCLALGVAALAGALVPRLVPLAGGLQACLRLTLAVFLDLAWIDEGRELWAAVAVYVALQDAEQRRVARWPLLPAACALAAALVWAALRPGLAPARGVLVALLAAAAAAWGHARRRRQG